MIERFIQQLKEEAGLYLGISFGVFLFILFFQPFPLTAFDFNNGLIFISGFAGIVFSTLVLVRGIVQRVLLKIWRRIEDITVIDFFGRMLMLLLSSVAFAFYLRYVGSVQLSFFIMAKVTLICLGPPVSIWIYWKLKEIIDLNEQLRNEVDTAHREMQSYLEDAADIKVEFLSERGSEKVEIKASDVVLIKSADNYIEIIFRENNSFKKRLLRNTLTNIEHQTSRVKTMVRCHRGFIVNTMHVEKMIRRLNSNWLVIKGYDEQVPVSRQYLLSLREALKNMG